MKLLKKSHEQKAKDLLIMFSKEFIIHDTCANNTILKFSYYFKQIEIIKKTVYQVL